MKFSFEGRLRNLRLPDGKTALLYSVFEAVMNGVQAIEERFGTSAAPTAGQIYVNLEKDKETNNVSKLLVTDNGIGLNPRHLDSFETCDTVEKSDRGGRGVGRLVWFKVFNSVRIVSSYEADGSVQTLSFRFDPFVEESLQELLLTQATGTEPGSQIILDDVKPEQRARLTSGSLARSLCHHFFPYFIAKSMPTLSIKQGRRSIDVGSYLESRMSVEKVEMLNLTAEGYGQIEISHVYVDPNIAKQLSNSILLAAQGRVVISYEIERKFALRELSNKRAYACVVRGPFLDEKVDQERTSFKVHDEVLESIKEHALARAGDFLAGHIKEVKSRKKSNVINILEEHPQLAVSVSNIDEYVESLSPGMSDEEIGKSLFTLLYRQEKKVRQQINDLANEDTTEEDRDRSVQALMEKVTESAQRRLAEYTIKRHQIIHIAKSMLRYADQNKQSYVWEKVVHEILCPMGTILSSGDYNDHNLWLIDDLLSYYHFFASDKAMSSFTDGDERKEPDLIFFNPFGFRREGTNDPVVIVEFKRPGDENLSSDPVDQVLGYIDKLRNRTVRSPDGEVISDISNNTPFECIIVCDLTSGARKKFERSLAQNPTPDGLGYYGFSPVHRASIRVLSYQKVFRDAEVRNQAFFSRLGLLPAEVRTQLASSAREIATAEIKASSTAAG